MEEIVKFTALRDMQLNHESGILDLDKGESVTLYVTDERVELTAGFGEASGLVVDRAQMFNSLKAGHASLEIVTDELLKPEQGDDGLTVTDESMLECDDYIVVHDGNILVTNGNGVTFDSNHSTLSVDDTDRIYDWMLATFTTSVGTPEDFAREYMCTFEKKEEPTYTFSGFSANLTKLNGNCA